MSVIPLDLQRRCEQRWAARFARQAPKPSPQKSENEKQGQQLGAPAEPKGKPAGPGSSLPSSDRDKANLKARETAQTWKAELFARIAFPKRLSSRNDKSEVPRLPRPRLGL